MKIYFAGSIRGGRDDADIYLKLVEELEKYGEVLTEHVATIGEEDMSDGEIFVRDLEWLTNCDAVVAEVTMPSLGVGFEVGVAQSLGIPVLCLYRPAPQRRLSAMLAGNPGIHVAEYYSVGEAAELLGEWFPA
ncbi:MAG: nucleoside 2-deoxyribosyltransferase [Acidimicrobiia bacterium]|nr:nucleoside 2-deoxyribosyltransferase [Acidimicrobiia bacterium]